MDNKNPYFDNKEQIEEIKELIKVLQVEKQSISDDIKDAYEAIYKLKGQCNHRYENGKSAVERTGQDAGSGKTEYACQICFVDPYGV